MIHPQLSVDKTAAFNTNTDSIPPHMEHNTHNAHQEADAHLTHHNPQPVPAHAKLSAHHVELKPAHTVNDVYFTSNVMEGVAVNSASKSFFFFLGWVEKISHFVFFYTRLNTHVHLGIREQ